VDRKKWLFGATRRDFSGTEKSPFRVGLQKILFGTEQIAFSRLEKADFRGRKNRLFLAT
jgi:hypothetical protein